MRTGDPAEQPPPGAAVREIALCLWFVVTGAAFWGTYAGLSLAAPLTSFYGLFLVASVVLLALRLLRGDKGDTTADRNAQPEQRRRRAKRPGGVDNQP
jgi:hypothetical protein